MSTPVLPGTVRVAPTPDEVFDHLGADLMSCALQAVEQRGVFHLALSGGSTPEPFYQRLVLDPLYRLIPWTRTHLWQVDERCVDEEDPRWNWKMIRETLADHIPTRRRLLHPMPVRAADGAEQYAQELRTTLAAPDNTIPVLDFVLLGMGADGHTASLFPYSPALQEQARLVAWNDGPRVTPPRRLTLTYPMLNAARFVAVLVTGAAKAERIREVAEQLAQGRADVLRVPVMGIRPVRGELRWYLDAPAAGVQG